LPGHPSDERLHAAHDVAGADHHRRRESREIMLTANTFE
jgi:hypothetical protein